MNSELMVTAFPQRRSWILAAMLYCSTASVAAQETTATQPIRRQIGAANGSVEEAFGFITDVDVDRDGNVLILDRLSPYISRFSPEGRFLGKIGRSGAGPGEFREPIRMTIDKQNRLHVLDGSLRRISIYVLDDGTARHLADQPVGGLATDICELNGHRYVLMPQESMIIQELDSAGRSIRSIVSAEEPDRNVSRTFAHVLEPVTTYYNQGVLACDADRQLIAILHENIPVVRVFRSDGRLAWRTVLGNYEGRELVKTDRGIGMGVRVNPRTGVAHAGSALAFMDGELIATLWKGGPADRQGVIEARHLDIQTGRETNRSVPTSRLVRYVDGIKYGYLLHPFPRVLIY